MNLIFLGQQGAGKGTYAQYVQENYGFKQISTGDLLREEAKKETGLGKKIKETMNEGKLLEDETVTEILEKRLMEKDMEKGFILDGYPRTLNQAKLLDEVMEKLNKRIHAAINFSVTDETSIQRLSGRRQCSKCNKIYHLENLPPKKPGICDVCGGELFQREDDKPEAIKKRLEEYRKNTKPLIDYYKEKNLLIEILADKHFTEVKPEIDKTLESIKQ